MMNRRGKSHDSFKENENAKHSKHRLVSDSTTRAHRAFSIGTSSSSNSSFEDYENDFGSQHEDTMERHTFEGLEHVLKGTRTTECRVSEYMNKREMTSIQEKVNALTIIPNVVYCMYFLLSGSWLSADQIKALTNGDELWLDLGLNEATKPSFLSTGCFSSSLFPHLYAIPPLPLIAIAFGICVHAPFSMVYHWVYARTLPPGFSRINHWSRRFDHIFLHVCSAFLSYGTSGRQDIFWVNSVYNLDCIYRQFETKVRPGRNKIRILIAVFGYTLPILARGDTVNFINIWAIHFIAALFFILYPIGGWSHTIFHLVLCVGPPILMNSALLLPSSVATLKMATQCAMSSAT